MLNGKQSYVSIYGKSGGLRYLGFRYDGSKVYLRDQTISNLWRKSAKIAKRVSVQAVSRYPGNDAPQIIARLNVGRILEKTGKVEDFLEKEHQFNSWTFWTYAKRADETFRQFGSGIVKQLTKHRTMVDRQLGNSVARAITQRADPVFMSKRKKK